MIYVLVNPKANNGCGEKDAREQVANLEGEKTFVSVLEIKNLPDFLKGLKSDDEVILTGGDGTLNHFANDLGDYVPTNKIYYVKSGSGNDFHRDCKHDCDDKGRILLNRYLKDLPVITVNGLKRRFINGIGYGLDGETCRIGDLQRVESDKPVNYSNIAVKLLLGKYDLKHATITVDGKTAEYDYVWLASTMIGRFYGGGLMVAPSQDRFNKERTVSVVCIHKKNRLVTLLRFPSLSKGEHIKKHDWCHIVEGKKVEVKFDKPCALQIDGEVVENVLSYSVEFSK